MSAWRTLWAPTGRGTKTRPAQNETGELPKLVNENNLNSHRVELPTYSAQPCRRINRNRRERGRGMRNKREVAAVVASGGRPRGDHYLVGFVQRVGDEEGGL